MHAGQGQRQKATWGHLLAGELKAAWCPEAGWAGWKSWSGSGVGAGRAWVVAEECSHQYLLLYLNLYLR